MRINDRIFIVEGNMLDSHGFDLWADDYDRFVNLTDDNDEYPFAGYKKLMNAIYVTVMKKTPVRVLDIGIGTGTLASRLYEHGNVITGIDFSSEMLERAKIKMPNATLIQYDFSKGLPFDIEKMKYDFIISTYALHHLSDTGKITFIYSLLKYLDIGGAIIIGDVSFPRRIELEECKVSCGDRWDDDEFYFVFSELEEKLNDKCSLSYRPFSHCSGMLEIRNHSL
jgi:putative AdoMet-dependent methyltransferase